MSKQSLVSVVMATYNEEPEIINKSIKSIQDQTYRNFELLIFDDSTNPETRNAIDAFTEDERIKVFRSPERVGFVKSLNLGLKTAKGKYIARMDGDDIALPIRFEKEVDAAGTTNPKETIDFTTRWCEALSKVTSEDYRIIADGKLYNILYVNPMGYKHRSLKFHCERVKR